MEFISEYPVDSMRGAQYNPREISAESFEVLKKSLETGICKPLIINKNGVVIAGHQRLKAAIAIGMKYVPVFVSKKKIKLIEEIKFNLIHNKLEQKSGRLEIKDFESIPNATFSRIDPKRIIISEKCSNAYVVETGKLLLKYGEFGAIVVDTQGQVVHNIDYAIACSNLNIAPLVYKSASTRQLQFLQQDYGVYNFTKLPQNVCSQTLAQPNRTYNRLPSVLYESYVLPRINGNKSIHILDFGCGKAMYFNRLRTQGYNICGYEPFPRANNKNIIDIKRVVAYIKDLFRHLSNQGLFDVIVLDSVLNSVSNDTLQDCVVATCNALLKTNGVMFVGTRNQKRADMASYQTFCGENRTLLSYHDPKGYSVAPINSLFVIQKHYGFSELKHFLSKYFSTVRVFDDKSQIRGYCQFPVKLDNKYLRFALENEFNFTYPGGYKHNQHKELVELICQLNASK